MSVTLGQLGMCKPTHFQNKLVVWYIGLVLGSSVPDVFWHCQCLNIYIYIYITWKNNWYFFLFTLTKVAFFSTGCGAWCMCWSVRVEEAVIAWACRWRWLLLLSTAGDWGFSGGWKFWSICWSFRIQWTWMGWNYFMISFFFYYVKNISRCLMLCPSQTTNMQETQCTQSTNLLSLRRLNKLSNSRKGIWVLKLRHSCCDRVCLHHRMSLLFHNRRLRRCCWNTLIINLIYVRRKLSN